MIGKKYTTSGFLIAFLIVIQFASTMVFAQTDTPIPTGDSDNDVINKLKQLLFKTHGSILHKTARSRKNV